MNGPRISLLSLLIALGLLAASVSVVAAAAPRSIHIEVPEIIDTSGEPFTASGTAVSDGIVCESGTVEDISGEVSGSTTAAFRILRVLKRFHCDDASGTFDVRLVVRLDNATNETTAQWRVVAGTGAYAGLQANGSLAGTPIIPGQSIYDVYDGKVY